MSPSLKRAEIIRDIPLRLVEQICCGLQALIKIQLDKPIYGIAGGLHLFASTGELIEWMASMLRSYHPKNPVAAHCTGIEATYLRQILASCSPVVTGGAVPHEPAWRDGMVRLIAAADEEYVCAPG